MEGSKNGRWSLDSPERLLQRPVSVFSTISPLLEGSQGLKKELGGAIYTPGQNSSGLEEGPTQFKELFFFLFFLIQNKIYLFILRDQ